MQLFGIRTKLIEPGEDLVSVILDAIHTQQLAIEDGDVLIIASKAVAVVQGRIVKLSSMKPSEEAKKLAEKYDMEPGYVEVVLQEAQKVYGGVSKALLTLKNNVLTPNAGADHKNAPKGCVVLWPENPHEVAEEIRGEILKRTGKRLGVLIVDSRVTPLRMGTSGVAIGIAGLEPVRDCRGVRDLYGKPLLITRHALADDLASAAHLVMGEVGERIPAVLVRDAPVNLSEKVDPSSVVISAEECLFMNLITQNCRTPPKTITTNPSDVSSNKSTKSTRAD